MYISYVECTYQRLHVRMYVTMTVRSCTVYSRSICACVNMYVCMYLQSTYVHTYICMYVGRWILVPHSSSYCYFLCMILGGTVASHTVQYACMYLKDLLHKGVCWLQVHLLTVLLDGWNEHRVVWFRQLHTREQVRRDALHTHTDGQT